MRFHRIPAYWLLLFTACAFRGNSDARDVDLSWSIRLDGIPAGSREAIVWIAVPQELPEQAVRGLQVISGEEHELVVDPEFGNHAVRVTVPRPQETIEVRLAARVRRYPVLAPRPASLSHVERALYLREEALVSLSPRIRALADSIGGDDRRRYEYVHDLMDYDKTVPGWGRGDSERACNVHKGNCTDYHSLFMSLERARGVPSMFEMGYSLLPEGETNKPGGYHCWAWFYARGAWVPVDISEGDKAPEKREYFFGKLDPDRITFSRGRQIHLPGMAGAPLNYFPSGAYAEVDAVPFERVTRLLTYSPVGKGSERSRGSS